MLYEDASSKLGRAPTGRHLTGFASLGASHASPLQAAHAPPKTSPKTSPPFKGGAGVVVIKKIPFKPLSKEGQGWL